jgi:predicted TIM-barrel fold metal-dependent hydrolase
VSHFRDRAGAADPKRQIPTLSTATTTIRSYLGYCTPYANAALRCLVPITQIMLGSDYPYVPIGDTVDGMRSLGFSPEELDAIGRNNALRLLPALCCA